MKTIHKLYLGAAACALGVALSSCNGRAGGQFQGREYMPDMGHSVAYEANVYGYYPQNRWGTEEEYRKAAEPGKPVPGTVKHQQTQWNYRAEQYASIFPVYHYGNTEEERTRATAEIQSNPLRPSNEAELKMILDKGKNLYGVYCGSCHGEKGDGNGQLYNNGSGPYPAKPANYLTDEFLAASDGRYYHAIMHGKNAMLSHADKLSFEERWMVIHYIRSLQAPVTKEPYTLAKAAGKAPAPVVKEEEKEDKPAAEDKKAPEKKGKKQR